jgi:kynurenine formamidase
MIIDLSAEIAHKMLIYPTPYLPAVEVVSAASHAETARSVQRVTFGTHISTHVDAPFHTLPQGLTVDRIPLDLLCGPALRLGLRLDPDKSPIEARHFKPHEARLKGCERLVLHTGWMEKTWGRQEYFTEGPYLGPSAAEYLVERGIRLLALDVPNVDRFEDTKVGVPAPRHRTLLENGVIIVENMFNLGAVPCDEFRLYVLPLKLTGGDGCPCRAIAEVPDR